MTEVQIPEVRAGRAGAALRSPRGAAPALRTRGCAAHIRRLPDARCARCAGARLLRLPDRNREHPLRCEACPEACLEPFSPQCCSIAVSSEHLGAGCMPTPGACSAQQARPACVLMGKQRCLWGRTHKCAACCPGCALKGFRGGARRDVQPAAGDLHQGQRGEAPPVPRGGHRARGPAQGAVGAEVDRQVRRAASARQVLCSVRARQGRLCSSQGAQPLECQVSSLQRLAVQSLGLIRVRTRSTARPCSAPRPCAPPALVLHVDSCEHADLPLGQAHLQRQRRRKARRG